MEQYDAFAAGIAPGGLRNQAQIELLLVFLLSNLQKPLTKEQLFAVLVENEIANYFNVSVSFEELLARGNLLLDETTQEVTITPKGQAAQEILEEDLPRAVREKALEAALYKQKIARRMQENPITIEPVGTGYHVTFSIGDKADMLLRLTVYVADRQQAEGMRKNFLQDPAWMYKNILELLSKQKEETPAD